MFRRSRFFSIPCFLKCLLWGALHRYRAIDRFTHVMDSLYAAGISPDAAWDAASLTVRNSKMAEKLKLVRQSFSSSSGVTGMIAAAGVFDHSDIGLASAGEKAGRLPEALSNIRRIYEQRAEGQRVKAHLAAIVLMNTFMIVLSGYAVIKMTATYFNSMFKIVGM